MSLSTICHHTFSIHDVALTFVGNVDDAKVFPPYWCLFLRLMSGIWFHRRILEIK